MSLKVGLFGLGMMGKNHARVLSEIEGVSLVSIIDSSLVGQKSNGLTVLGNDVDLDQIDYAVISVPTVSHLEVALNLIDKRISLLIEKPLAHSSVAGLDILNASNAYGVKVGIGHIERFNAAMRKAKEALETGILGEVIQVCSRRTGPFPNRVKDVGVVLDLATHDIDATAWLTSSEYQSVYANGYSNPGREFEDAVHISAKLNTGIIVNHEINWISPLKERKTIVTGTQGSMVIDTLTSDLTIYEQPDTTLENNFLAQLKGTSHGSVYSPSFVKREALVIEHETFRDFLLGKSNDVVSPESGLKTLYTAEAILESLKTSKAVTL
jgi:predicted dehydrogenase